MLCHDVRQRRYCNLIQQTISQSLLSPCLAWPPPTARIAPPVTVYSVGKVLMRGDLVFTQRPGAGLVLAWSPHAMMIGIAAATPSIVTIERPHPPHSPHFHAETQQTSHRDHSCSSHITLSLLSPFYHHHHHCITTIIIDHCITTVSPLSHCLSVTSHHRWCTDGEWCRSLYN